MNERINAFLDGDLPLDALSPAERAEAVRLSTGIDAAAARLRAMPAPDLTARVMAALPADAPRGRARSPLAALLGWLWSPTPVRLMLRPAYGFAFAMVALLALVLARPHARPAEVLRGVGPAVAAAPDAPPVYVQFRIRVPDARSVAIAGTFTGWKPAVSLRETAPGEWTALVPLRPGVHDYAFVVDGQRWMPDPNAPQVDDSFGGTNSRISLPPLGAS
ncbi:glycogen-binding domain-containing protein [Longimicrobium sp.]|uniref:glycogen-binding domain-containing protein n=1 Tax=Longimicrobium sp. TaxID=2029185 RepID=UPI002B5C1DE1|nr:glycogen-binding domain-containing protein [Longimicrobium sp.]HSU17831.1 glycogen-binding domain-containing protein [Longimicrobium sp.]